MQSPEELAAQSPEERAAAVLARAQRPSGFLARLPALTDDVCLHVGLDENGLGPVLGPMIVTGVAFRFRGPRPTSLGALVGDSKALVSHADVSLGEAWARALLAAIGDVPRSPADVIERLSMDALSVLRAPCPSREGERANGAVDQHPAAMCWPEAPESFVADDALVERCARTIRGWATAGDDEGRKGGRFRRRIPLEVVGLRASILCASRLNDAKAQGRHKFAVDLHEMERIALSFHAASAPVPLDAVCGKVGGMGYYSDYFGPLAGNLRAIEAESEMASAYRFPGLGRLTFLQDADAADPLVGLASIVGKYLRELLMGRIVRYMQAAHERSAPKPAAELAPASGYRDPNTKRFIAATELVRRAHGVPDRCFLRTS